MRAGWLETCKPPVVPGTRIHAVALTPMALYVVWWSWTTFLLVVVVSVTMAVLQAKGRRPMWVVNRLQSRLRRETITARSLWYRRRRTRLESLSDVDLDEAYSIRATQPAADRAASSPSTAKTAARARSTTKPEDLHG